MSDKTGGIPEAAGPGANAFDARSLFYLSNREQIDEWYGLRYDAGRATRQFLSTALAGPLADEVAPDLEVKAGSSNGYVYHFAVPATTVVAPERPPAIGVCMGWHGGQCVSVDEPRYAPFISVRAELRSAAHAHFRAALTPDLREGYEANGVWPVWRKVLADGPWWEDLDGYIDQARGAVRELVDRFGPLVEAARLVERREPPVGESG